MGHPQASIQGAVEDALATAGATALIDVVVEGNWVDLLLFGFSCTTVQGTAVRMQ